MAMADGRYRFKNVVIFGETGAGKSSIVNMLTQTNCAEISNAAVGCTFQSNRYIAGEYALHDTVGLSEGSKGTKDAVASIRALVTLLKTLNTDGVSLLVLVAAKGKITKAFEGNYTLLVNVICCSKVPAILVVTHCEQELDPAEWFNNNKSHFDKYGMVFHDVICGTATQGQGLHPFVAQITKTLYPETRQKLQESIKKHSMSSPWKMDTWQTWFVVMIKRSWNVICKIFDWPLVSLWPSLLNQLVKCGLGPIEALELSNDLCVETAEEAK